MPYSAPEAAVQLRDACQTTMKGQVFPADYIQGMVFAVCAAPEIPMPEQWLGWTFKQRTASSLQSEQIDQFANILMSLLQTQLAKMRENDIGLPMSADPQSAFAPDSATSQWLNGLLAGHSQLEPVWQSAWGHVEAKQPDLLIDLQKDLKHCLMMFTTFANVPLALEHAEKVGNQKLATNLTKIYQSLPAALKSYVDISGKLVDFLPEQFETFAQSK